MRLKGKRLVLGLFFLLFFVTIEMVGQVINNSGQFEEGNVERKSSFNIEEIKVRWKKAALDNCTGVPCVVTPPAPSFICGTSTIMDIDNNSYNTVEVGTQCWTKENLRVRKYNDGTVIRFDKSGGTAGNISHTWGGLGLRYGAHTLYEHDSTAIPSNLSYYGYLYNWYAVAGIIGDGGPSTKNICPTGWHVPSDPEWTVMIQNLDPSQVVNSVNVATFTGDQSTTAGIVMKSGSNLWSAASPASPRTNTSDFSVLPGGYREIDGSFYDVRDYASFWTATEFNSLNAWYRDLNHDNSNVGRDNYDKPAGLSVRCLKD